MTGSNHVVTGALIAVAVPQAVVAVPLALVSHFVLDALPHYGDNDRHSWLNRHFMYVLAIDATISVGFLICLLIWQPANWVLMVVCALVSVAPDAIWIKYLMADRRGEDIPHSAFARFSKWIQWGERPWGIYIEIATLIALLSVFLSITV